MFETDLTAAQQPVITNVATNGADVTLAWDDRSQTETAFLVQWHTNNGPTTVVSRTSSPWLHELLAEGATYSYRVGATNSGNGSFTGYSAWTNAVIPVGLPPVWAAPSLEATSTDSARVACELLQADGDVTVVWAATDQGATNLAIWTAAPRGGSATLGQALVDTTVSNLISALPADAAYAYRFYGTNAHGEGWSDAGSFITDLGTAQTPLITDADADLFSVTVDWQANSSNETGFVLQWHAEGGVTNEASVGAMPFVHTGVGQGQTYHYRVAATNSVNGSTSGYSAWTNATVAVLPSDLLAYDLFSGVSAVNNVTLDGQNYSSPDVAGFTGPWVRHGGNARTARNFNSDVAAGLQTIGSNGSLGGVWDGNAGYSREAYSTRELAPAAHVDLDSEGTTYWSFYGRSIGDASLNCGFASGREASDAFFNVGLIWNNATSIGGAGNDAADKFYVGWGTLDGGTDNGVYGVRSFGDKAVNKDSRLFFVGRIEASTNGDDTVSMSVYDAGNLPEAGPDAVAWVATNSLNSTGTYTHLVFGFNGNGSLEFDGFRMGTNWAAVVGTYAEASPVRALGFNFVGNTTAGALDGRSPGSLVPADLAGASGLVQANWNNLQTASSAGGGAPSNVVDSAGDTVGTTVEFASNNPYGTGIGDWAADNRLMRGYLDDSATTTQPYALVNGIPFSTYDVVIYADNDTGAGITYGPYWVETLDATDLTPRVYMTSPYGNFAGAYLPVSTDSTVATTAEYGNYVVFRDLSGSGIRIRGMRQPGITRGIMNAFQIVNRQTGPNGMVLFVKLRKPRRVASGVGDVGSSGSGGPRPQEKP